MSKVAFGSDPEYFIAYEKDGEKFVLSPALLMADSGLKQIGGDVKHPVFISTESYHWMMDGVACELTLRRPFDTMHQMISVIRTALDHLEETVKSLSYKDFGELSLVKLPAISIDPLLYKSRLDNPSIFQGFIFGCDTDYDAIDLEYECKTVDVTSCLERYGGGHLHTSGSEMFEYYPVPAIRFMAITVGNFVTLNTPVPDLEKRRIQTYGRPGRYREQKYPNGQAGVEYRTPSNSWTGFDDEKVDGLDFWTRKAVEFLEETRVDVLREFLDTSVEAIIGVDKEKARSVLESLK